MNKMTPIRNIDLLSPSVLGTASKAAKNKNPNIRIALFDNVCSICRRIVLAADVYIRKNYDRRPKR